MSDQVTRLPPLTEVEALIRRAQESQNRLNRILYVLEGKVGLHPTGAIGPSKDYDVMPAVVGRLTSSESNLKPNVQRLNIPQHHRFCTTENRCECDANNKIKLVFEAIEGFMIHAIKNGADESTLFFFEKVRKILS